MCNLICKVLFVCAIINSVCLSAPNPAIVPTEDLWTVDVKFTHPKQIVMPFRGNIQSQRYWYTIVTITNNFNEDIHFYPKCDLMTDTFQIKSAGTDVGKMIFNKIKIRHQGQYPFIEFLQKTETIVRQGEENAKDIAIIWSDFDTQARSVKMFLTGFSNETVIVEHPVQKDKNNMPLKVFLRKTLELSYKIEGESESRSDKNLVYSGKRWIMR